MKVIEFANMEYLRFMAMVVGDDPNAPKRRGSFSQFGFNNESSIWFTSWVLMTLRDATHPDWEEKGLFIDPRLRKDVVGFFILRQYAHGAWGEITTIEDRNKFGNRWYNVSGRMEMLNISLTATALISLQLNSDIIERTSGKSLSGAIQRGREWLERNLVYINDAFDMAIVTYALHLTKSPEKDNAFLKLRSFKKISRYF